MQDFFYWMGVIYSGLFLLMGFGIFAGVILNYIWSKMKDMHGLVEVMTALKTVNKHKP